MIRAKINQFEGFESLLLDCFESEWSLLHQILQSVTLFAQALVKHNKVYVEDNSNMLKCFVIFNSVNQLGLITKQRQIHRTEKGWNSGGGDL